MAPTLDLRPLLHRIEGRLERHALGPLGAYARFADAPARGGRADPYGCADAANLLYTLGSLPTAARSRRAWVETLCSLQDPASGLFHEDTHHPIHTTAHCVAALELFDARPRHPLSALAELRDPDALEAFLDGLDWKRNPWLESHRGAGVYAALVLAGDVSPNWQERYFDWLDARTDPRTGLLRAGCVPEPENAGVQLFPHLAGTFHYLFNREHAHRRWPHAPALVDTCLTIFEDRLFPFSTHLGFAEIDWVYCLNRSLRLCDHRADEVRRALNAFAGEYVGFLDALDLEADEGARDLHRLFGAVCALAELQAALPGSLRSEVPLRLVLDRRPFI